MTWSTGRIPEPRRAYDSQRHRAKTRGIEFALTFDEWWGLWAPHWERREAEYLMMCRQGDSGGYTIGNVRIDTARANNRERHKRLMKTYKLYWSPEGKEIAAVRATTMKAAIRKAPYPYRRYLGELYAIEQKEQG